MNLAPTPGRARRRRAASLGLLLAVGCDAQATPAPAPPPGAEGGRAPAVEAVQAREGTLPLEERVGGVVRARNQLVVRAELEGVVAEVLAETGQAVTRGQPLVRLRDDLLGDRLRQAEASVRLEEAAERGARARVAELEAQLQRTRALVERRLVTPLELDVLQAQRDGAQAEAEQATARVEQARAVAGERRTSLERLVVRAPIEGRVGLRRVEVGSRVDPSTPLFELGDLSSVVVAVPLADFALTRVRVGQPATISAPALGDPPLAATLTRLSPFLAQGSFSATGELDLENAHGRLRPGMFVTVDLVCGESERATLVPLAALWEDPSSGAQGVFVVELPPDTPVEAPLSSAAVPVALRPVEVRARGRASVGVRGVDPGAWVVTIGQHLLGREARRARVRPAAWERVMDLQARQREDLLRDFLERQQRHAREHGAAPPSTREFFEPAPPGGPPAPAGPGG